MREFCNDFCRLELVGNLVMFIAAVLAVDGRDSLNPGMVGFALSYALSITNVSSHHGVMVSLLFNEDCLEGYPSPELEDKKREKVSSPKS